MTQTISSDTLRLFQLWAKHDSEICKMQRNRFLLERLDIPGSWDSLNPEHPPDFHWSIIFPVVARRCCDRGLKLSLAKNPQFGYYAVLIKTGEMLVTTACVHHPGYAAFLAYTSYLDGLELNLWHC